MTIVRAFAFSVGLLTGCLAVGLLRIGVYELTNRQSNMPLAAC
jgi:hypothetical protein